MVPACNAERFCELAAAIGSLSEAKQRGKQSDEETALGTEPDER